MSSEKLFSSGRGSFLSLSGHAGGPPVHNGASVGHGRNPWRVRRALKAAKSGMKSGDCSPSSWSQQGPCKKTPKICPFSPFHFFQIFSPLCCFFLFCKYHSSRFKSRQPRYNSRALFPFITATSYVSACVRVSVRVYACVIIRSSSAAVGTRKNSSLKNRCHSAFVAPFHVRSYAVCCCCVPVSHRKLFTLWQPRYYSSRPPRWCTVLKAVTFNSVAP